MWSYNYTPSSDDIMHYGTLGMRWGHRKARKENHDFNKLKKEASNAQNAGKKYMDFQRKHTYQISGTNNKIVMDNPNLYNKYRKQANRADKSIKKMMKKYGDVSVNANFDTEKGKSYLDIKMGNRKERVYAD